MLALDELDEEPPRESAESTSPVSRPADPAVCRRITPAFLLELCKREPGCYETPDLNEKLYLNHKGIRKLEQLEAYCNVAALFLDCNALRVIEGISHMTQLRQLYLNNNSVERISGLEELHMLQTLSLAHNRISRVEGVATLEELSTLNLANNHFEACEALEPLGELPKLSSLDLGSNHISDGEGIMPLCSRFKTLRCLVLAKNPCCRKMQNYRRGLIGAMPELLNLDQKPVFELERLTSDAWYAGKSKEEVEATRVAWVLAKQGEKEKVLTTFREEQAKCAAQLERMAAGEDPGEGGPRPLGFSQAPVSRISETSRALYGVSEDEREARELAAPLRRMWHACGQTDYLPAPVPQVTELDLMD